MPMFKYTQNIKSMCSVLVLNYIGNITPLLTSIVCKQGFYEDDDHLETVFYY